MTIFYVTEDNQLKINDNCLLIPELKAVVDAYEDPIPALAYLNFMTNPESPYHELLISEKEDMISKDVDGDFGTDDEVIIAALEKLRILYTTPMQEYYEGQKNSMLVMGRFLKNLTEGAVVMGRDGNLTDIRNLQKEAGKTIESFMKLEKLWKEQVQQKMRGGAELGEY
jgi:hypothetical protein